jgi:hypothetical protein
MRPGRLALAASVAPLVGPAAQAEGISGKFDGHYAGSSQLVKPLSGSSCDSAGMRYRIDIRNGRIDGDVFDIRAQDTTPGSINGFATSDGYFTGHQKADRGVKTRFEGNIDDSNMGADMVAGVLTHDDSCAWVVTLDER